MSLKVLVSAPTYAFHAYCLDLYAEHLRRLDYPDFDVLLVDNSPTPDYVQTIQRLGIPALRVAPEGPARTTLATCRNLIRRIVLDRGYDYLLFLDQDVFPPPDALTRLIEHRQPVVSGIYTKWCLGRRWAVAAGREWRPTRWSDAALTQDPAGMIPLAHLPADRLIPIHGAGHGCLLIARAVLQDIHFRYDPDYDNDSDLYFAADVLAAGLPFYLDTTVRCRHFYVMKDYVRWKPSQAW